MRNRRKPRAISFIAMCIMALILAAGLIFMMILFARRPELAPPGICEYIAYAVPAILMLLLLLAMAQRVSDMRRS